MKHSPHLDALEAQLRNIGENEGGEALRDAARDIFYAVCSVIASTSGVAELARSRQLTAGGAAPRQRR